MWDSKKSVRESEFSQVWSGMTVLSMPFLGKFLALFGVLLGLAASPAALASSVGPFEFRSERSVDFQKPPYKTGIKVKCEAAFVGNFSSVSEVRAAVREAGPLVEQKLIDLVMKRMPLAKRQELEARYNLSCAVCRGASFLMVPQLDVQGIRLNITPVLTPWIPAIQSSHIYLTHQNYFGPGQHLIIDPTIRQFFSSTMSKEDLHKKIPQVFVGTAAELEALFLRHFLPSEQGFNMKAPELVPYYLHPDPIDYLLDPSA